MDVSVAVRPRSIAPWGAGDSLPAPWRARHASRFSDRFPAPVSWWPARSEPYRQARRV